MRIRFWLLSGLLILSVVCCRREKMHATDVTDGVDLTEAYRLVHAGPVVLKGIGAMTGLGGRGDTDRDEIVRRFPALREGADGAYNRDWALVQVTLEVPPFRSVNDRLIARVRALRDAESLLAGRLEPVRLYPDNDDADMALAEGGVLAPDPASATAVSVAAQMTRDYVPRPMDIKRRFLLVPYPQYNFPSNAGTVAFEINTRWAPRGVELARANPDNSVSVIVPAEWADYENHWKFIEKVMRLKLSALERHLAEYRTKVGWGLFD